MFGSARRSTQTAPRMNEATPEPNSKSQNHALTRFRALNFVEDQLRAGRTLAEALRQASLLPWLDEQGDFYKPRTLEDWWYTYKKSGFNALLPLPRCDQGTSRRLDASTAAWLTEQVLQNPDVPLKVLYAHWKSQGRTLSCEGKALATHLCVLVDDHSRLIPFAAYYPHPNTEAFHHALKEAVLRRGLPRKLYTDQGKPFVNSHTRLVCAQLGIRLLHCRPYHAFSKGKCERLIQTIQQGFESTLRLKGNHATHLEDLNAKLSAWIQTVYHLRAHSSTGVSPEARYQQAAKTLRHLPTGVDPEPLFYLHLQRRVRKNGTIRLDNDLYEVPLSLRSLQVQLRLDPWRRTRIEVWYQGKFIGLARKAPLHLNSQTNNSYDP